MGSVPNPKKTIHTYRHFFPETVQVTTPEDITGHLERLDKIIIKPEFGAGGTGIYLLSKNRRRDFGFHDEKGHQI
ncbi:hypothetical protein RCO48_01070 [Peribacillus frigoritolerans]|nr:hypothetical protein [Peribacillus frigoritolerans]